MISNLVNKIKKHSEIRPQSYYTVITPKEIQRIKKPFFSDKKSLVSFKDYLEECQPLFEDCKNKTFGNEYFKELKKIWITKKPSKFINNFYYDFFDLGKCIDVQKNKNGKYIVCSNGRHRIFAAKKYGLNILVYVVQEEC